MGHMLNNTLQDIIIVVLECKDTMPVGFPVPTTHLLLQRQRVARLKEQGIEKSTLSREAF